VQEHVAGVWSTETWWRFSMGFRAVKGAFNVAILVGGSPRASENGRSDAPARRAGHRQIEPMSDHRRVLDNCVTARAERDDGQMSAVHLASDVAQSLRGCLE